MLLVLALSAATGCKARERRADWFTAGRTTWQLESLMGKHPIEGTKITLLIRSDGRLAGHAGVNKYFGSYALGDEDGEIRTWRITSMQAGWTEWEGVQAQEDLYFALLGDVDGYSLGTHDLEFFVGDMLVARFVPVL
jgi:hypothetical protein